MKRRFSCRVLLLALFMLSFVCSTSTIQPVKASGTIYIKADGTVDPPTAPIQRIGDVYTFTDNIYDQIVVGKSNIVIDGAGCTLQGTGSGNGITLDADFGYSYGLPWPPEPMEWPSGVTIKNLEIRGFFYGILIVQTYPQYIYENEIRDNEFGIYIVGAAALISGNDIISCYTAITLEGGVDNIISGNNINSNDIGIDYHGAWNNKIYENNIANNDIGLWNRYSSENKIYHNNFIDNAEQVRDWYYPQPDSWDDGYPSGGNYWSDYTDVDLFSGPGQDEPGSDKIWDHPYTAFSLPGDRYPLTQQDGWKAPPPPPGVPEFPFGTVLLASLAWCAYFLFRKKQR